MPDPHEPVPLPSALRRLAERKLVQWLLAYLAVAWVALQIVDVVAAPLGLTTRFQRVALVLLLAGVPVVLVLAWFHGERGRQRVSGVELLILAALLGATGVAVGFLPSGGEWAQRPPAAPSQRGSLTVAVLPFTNLGPEAEDGYFGTAMTEELIGMLSRIEGVQVKSRTSVRRYEGSEMDVARIAEELGVEYVLEGGVRKADGRVRITVQLTEASSGFEEWSDVFDGESDDWFALHEELALQIADALDLHLTPSEAEAVRAHYTEDEDAYDAFWRGWLLLESFHADLSHPEEKLRTAERHFQDALELDPSYPLALAGLSVANSYHLFYRVDPTDERRRRAEELARRALALEDELPEVHVALAMVSGNRGDHVEATAKYREALRLERGNAMVWCLLAFSCNWQTPPDPPAAEEAAREAIRIDPTWFYSYLALGQALEQQGEYAEAAEAFETATQLSPEWYSAHFDLGRTRLELEEYEEALAAFEAAKRVRRTATVEVHIGAARLGLGDTAGALDAVERGLASGFGELDALRGSPYFASVRDHPRFRALLGEP